MPKKNSERDRVLTLIEAHYGFFKQLGSAGKELYMRLVHVVRHGIDLEKEAGLPLKDRVSLPWLDASAAEGSLQPDLVRKFNER